MSWRRLVNRNGLFGNYGEVDHRDGTSDYARQMIAGDARRMERDQRDEGHLRMYAAIVGITSEQVKAVLDIVFDQDCPPSPHSFRTASDIQPSETFPDI